MLTRAPDFVDDGFGGKNSHVVIADMLGGDDDAAAAKAKINFISWSMIGVQAGYNTQGAIEACIAAHNWHQKDKELALKRAAAQAAALKAKTQVAGEAKSV